MASSSGTSSGSGSSVLRIHNSGSEEDLQLLMEQRKRKRMISNRESARRSRLRKQKHLDDLMGQVSQLRKENNQIFSNVTLTNQHYLNVEAENSILRAQVAELSHRLQSLCEIIAFLDIGFGSQEQAAPPPCGGADQSAGGLVWNIPFASQPLMAGADMLHY